MESSNECPITRNLMFAITREAGRSQQSRCAEQTRWWSGQNSEWLYLAIYPTYSVADIGNRGALSQP